MESVAAAREAVGVIERGERIYLVSQGSWATEHVICHLGEQLGPIDLWLATWAVNDDAVLRLANAMEAGYVRECRALVDERMKVLRPAALDVMQTALGEGNLGIMACHMKVYVCRAVDGSRTATMVGSNNWTQNPRPEALVIDSDPRAAEFFSRWIDEALRTQAKPYRHTGKLRSELISTTGRTERDDLKAALADTELAEMAQGKRHGRGHDDD